MKEDLVWIHRFIPGSAGLLLLLLHGTGGNEESLIDFGGQVAPGAALLGVRGRCLDEGVPRFFRRFTAVSYDQENLIGEADALARFSAEAARRYGVEDKQILLLGYSNGANIALASLVRNQQQFAAAALLRPVMPFDRPPQAALNSRPVLVAGGAHDPYLSYGKKVAPYLKAAGAAVDEQIVDAGHEITLTDLRLTKMWIEKHLSPIKTAAARI